MNSRAVINQVRSGGKSEQTAERRKHVLALIDALPDVTAVPIGKRHLSLEARGKRFGWFLNDHHGDGRAGLNLKTAKKNEQTIHLRLRGNMEEN